MVDDDVCTNNDKYFKKSLINKVDNLFANYKKRLTKKEKKKKSKEEDEASVNQGF